MPQFSIIIPVYRVEEYLEKCVDSILAQTCQDFELLLIGDGSPDGSGAICDRYAASHPTQVRALHQPTGGAGAARNRGIELAQGDYLLFVDGDDWLAPNLLEDLSASIAATPADLYLFGALVERDGKSGRAARASVRSSTHEVAPSCSSVLWPRGTALSPDAVYRGRHPLCHEGLV
ncbi:MAG: glycosyltransferase family 2 protein [Oscillospiraceae bacterium]